MSAPLSENAFNKGLAAVARGRYLEAMAYFDSATELTRRAGTTTPTRYLSYYGLCLAMASNRIAEAREICEQALLCETGNADLYLNLSQVHMKAGDRSRAFIILVRGLKVDGRHRGLIRAMHQLGFRRRPVLRFLGRRHPLNRLLGWLRAAIRERRSPGWRCGSPARST